MPPEKAPDVLVKECLDDLGLSRISEWDTLIFLYRHGPSLGNVHTLSKLLGYTEAIVSNALDKLDILGLISQSHFSQGMRLYEFIPGGHSRRLSSFDILASPDNERARRVLVSTALRKRGKPARVRTGAGLHFA